MALNAFMHPRNTYRTPPDFKELVADYPEVRPYMTTVSNMSLPMRQPWPYAWWISDGWREASY